MDLNDSFTDKLFKRSKARKDYLKVKMKDNLSRKKRTILLEELQIPNNNKEPKKSPKPLCIEQLTSVKEEGSTEEVKENVSGKKQEMKGSNYMSSEPTKEETFFRTRNLAESKKSFAQDERKSQSSQLVDNPPTSVFPTCHTELCSIRDRLARLALDINGWEDNLTRSTASPTSSTQDACSTVAKKVEDTLNRSFEPSNLPISARRAIFEKAATESIVQSKNQTFKTKVSVAQQAAMFENAPKNKVRFRTFHQKPSNTSSTKSTKNVRGIMKLSTAESSAVLKETVRQSSALARSSAKSPTGSPAESSLGFRHDSPIKPYAATTRTVTKLLTASPAKSCPIFSWDSSTKPSPVLTRNLTNSSTRSPSKSSPAFRYGSPAKPEANTGSSTTTTKSFIPKLIMSPSQQKWAKTARTEPEKKLPFSSLVDHWEKLSSSNVTIQ